MGGSGTGDSGRITARMPSFAEVREAVSRRLFAAIEPGTPDMPAERYVVVGRIGSGGMGVVLRGFDVRLRREVALKRVRSTAGSEHELRLEREAQTLAALHHPNITAVHDLVQLGGQLYLVMEYVDGIDLQQWLARAARGRDQILDVFGECARALAAAHAVRIVHRDFKPSNVLIGDDGRVRVTDFGLARQLEDSGAPSPIPGVERPPSASDVALTVSGSLVGTAAYMAPEQHDRADVDARADQYAWCVALWEALCGKRPFAGDASELARNKRQGPPPLPLPAAPRWLQALLQRGLAVDPDQRFSDMDELVRALERGRRSPARRRAALLAIGLAGLAIVGYGGAIAREHRLRADCVDRGAEIAEIWNDESRTRVRLRQSSSSVPYALDSIAYATGVLDRHAARLAAAQQQLCEDHEIDDRVTATVAAGAQDCLDDRRARLARVVRWLETTETVRDLAARVGSVGEVESCRDELWLAGRPAPPDDPGTRAEVEAMRERLERIAERPATADEVEDLLARVDAIGWAPLRAEARFLLGRTMSSRADFERGLGLHSDALALAVEIGDLTLASYAAAYLGAAQVRVDASDAPDWGRLGVALALRAGGSPLTRVNAWGTLAVIEHKQRDFPAAIALLMRVIATLEFVVGPRIPEVASAYGTLALSFDRGGSPPAGDHLRAHALSIMEETLGPAHPEVAMMLIEGGESQVRRELAAEALAAGDRARAILEVNFAGLHELTPRVEDLRGSALHGLGRDDEALASFTKALAALDELDAEAEDRVTVERSASRFYREIGDLENARTLAGRALRRATEGGMSPRQVALAQRVLGAALVLDPATVADGRAMLLTARAAFEAMPAGARDIQAVDEALASAVAAAN